MLVMPRLAATLVMMPVLAIIADLVGWFGGAIIAKYTNFISIEPAAYFATMRQYMETEAGKKVFRRTYEEALSVAFATGTRPERLAVDPIPPGWASNVAIEQRYESWVEEIIAFYGDVKPSMLQDFERGRKTEIDFINGYVVTLGHASGVPVHMNAAITDLVHQIERGVLQPTRERMNELADQTERIRGNSI